MRLSDIITPASIAVGVRIGDKTTALKFASERLATQSGLKAGRIQEALAAREALGSTGIGAGVAVPHVCLPELARPHVCFFTLAEPIGFDSIDNRTVDLICAIIAPSGSGCGKNEPLSYLAAISRILRDKAKAQRLRNAKNLWAVYDILSNSTEPAGRCMS